MMYFAAATGVKKIQPPNKSSTGWVMHEKSVFGSSKEILLPSKYHFAE